ncbi:MAG TPA: hypothetical protein VNL71_18515, partial [Chloroflexota bacterium]|nr:hypothetical protein [Chloroflexota bacterium]
AAGVGFVRQQGAAAGDGGAQAGFEESEPGGLVEGFAGDDAQGDLRGRAVERGAEEQSTAVCDGEKGGRVAGAGLKLLDVGGIDPEMAGAESVGGAAADAGSGGG